MSATAVGRRAALDVLGQIVGRALNLMLGVAVTLILVRSLGDRGFGEWATVLTVKQLATYLGEMGLEPAAVRRAAADPERGESWVSALVLVRLALTAPAMAIAIASVVFISRSTDMVVAGTVICLTQLLSAASALRVVFQLRMRNDIPVAVMTVNSILWTGGAAALAAAGSGVVGFAVLFLAVAVVSTALQAALALRVHPIALRHAVGRVGDLLRVGIPLGIGGLLTLAYVRIDQLLVYQLAGERQAGLYGAVYRILDQAQFIPIALTTTLLPLLSAAHAVDRQRLSRLLQMGFDLVAVASLPVLAFSIVAAKPTVTVLFGSDFADAAPALPVLMAAYVLICFGYLFGSMIVVLDLQMRLVAYSAAALVFNVALNLVLIPPFGFVAAAWVTLATQVMVLAVGAAIVLRRIRIRLAVHRLAGVAAAAAIMAATVQGLEAAGAPFAALVVAAAIAYPVVLLALRVVDLDELRALLRRTVPA